VAVERLEKLNRRKSRPQWSFDSISVLFAGKFYRLLTDWAQHLI